MESINIKNSINIITIINDVSLGNRFHDQPCIGLPLCSPKGRPDFSMHCLENLEKSELGFQGGGAAKHKLIS